MPIGAYALTFLLAQGAGDPSLERRDPRVVVLSATGSTRDGLPVAVPHPDPGDVATVLSRGYAKRLVRLYEMAQRFARPESAPQPAYLVLTDNQGGFPRQGLFLDRAQPRLAYVDLHRRSTPSGRAGALDQIYPHELLHLIVADLAGPPPEGHATQVHAVGVCTDRVTAFSEGFAEHGQLMAIDDPGAMPATRAIASDTAARDRAFDHMRAYRAALTARWSVATRSQMTFPLWFSRTEQVLRYHAVRENRFARAPEIPERLLTERHAYRAYLIENVLPAEPDGRPRPVGRMLATEGVVSYLFYRLVTSPAIQSSDAATEFYARFGTTRAAIDGLDNAYLKLFAAIRAGRYDALSVIRAMQAAFPADAAAIEGVLRDALLNQPVPAAEALWMLNRKFTAGTTLFDQFRAAPIAQAFDLNAASKADLAAVPRMTPEVISAILSSGPYGSLQDLRRVPGVTADLIAEFERMRKDILSPPAPGTEREGQLSIRAILMPYVWRAVVVWIVCAGIAAVLYRQVRRIAWWRAALDGLAAALLGLLAGWLVERGGPLPPFAVPLVVCGVPAALWQLRKARAREAGRVLAAWAAAAIVAALAVTPLG